MLKRRRDAGSPSTTRILALRGSAVGGEPADPRILDCLSLMSKPRDVVTGGESAFMRASHISAAIPGDKSAFIVVSLPWRRDASAGVAIPVLRGLPSHLHSPPIRYLNMCDGPQNPSRGMAESFSTA